MTIEERAKEYAGKTGFREGGYYWQRRFDAYIEGATEQKTRTLNKVYNIITEELGESCGTALIKVIQNAFGE